MARRKTWLADRIRAVLPSRESLERNRVLRPVAHLVLRPDLWRFTVRSVPRAIGLGVFIGILVMIPFVQPLSAALLSVPVRANVPLATITTQLSNPATTPFIAVAALWLGSTLFGLDADPNAVLRMLREQASIAEWWHWLWSDGAPSLLMGLIVISTVAGAVSYGLAAVLWRWWIAHKWRARPWAKASPA